MSLFHPGDNTVAENNIDLTLGLIFSFCGLQNEIHCSPAFFNKIPFAIMGQVRKLHEKMVAKVNHSNPKYLIGIA